MKKTERELKQEIKILELQKKVLELQLEIERIGGYKYVPYTPPVWDPPVVTWEYGCGETTGRTITTTP